MGTQDQRHDDDRRYQDQGGRSMTRADERQGDRSMQRGGEGAQDSGGNWYGYVQPYRYYGPGYHGVGYYSVIYQGGDAREEQDARSGQHRGAEGWQGGPYGQSGQDDQGGQSRQGDQRHQSGQSFRDQGSGGYAGRGPRGYQRSDERIREDISDRLMEHPDIDASDIEVQVKDGEVTLQGTVDERRTKRMAEDLAEDCSGVRDVMNQLKVRRASGESGQGGQEQAQQRDSGSDSRSDASSDAAQGSRGGLTGTSRSSGDSTSQSGTTEPNGSARDRSNDRQPANQR